MSFHYTEDDADLSGLISAKLDLDRIFTKLRGDTVQYNDIVDTTATEFSDLVSDSIRTVATENQDSWQSAMMACICAHGVIDQWISDIRWYRDRIDEIQADFSSSVTGVDDFTEYSAIESSHISQAQNAYEQLEIKSDSCSDMLAAGPTPETVRQLIEAGHLGMAPFAVTGDYVYYPYDESSAEDLAERIRTGDFGGNYDDLHEAALALSERAAGAAANGQRLSESELDFLEALLHGTDDVLLDLHNDGLRGDPSTPQQQEIAAMLGMSIVALSHTSAGGGHDRLPESIRTVSNGVREGTGYFLGGPGNSNAGYGKWLEDAEGLTYLLDQARHPNGTPMQLGEETSLKLTAAVSEVAGAVPSEHNRYDTSITYRPDEGEQTTMSRLLGFSTANEDANHTLLTNASEPNGRDAEQILTDLYTFDWNDDGRAVSGLTDWIANGETSADPQEPDRSREALVGLMDIVSSEIMQEKLEQTGQEVDDTMTVMDAEGETSTEEFSWKDVSIGHLNPELAGGFADIFDSHIDVFASLDGMDKGEPIPGFENVYEDGQVMLSRDAREAFTQIIAGSEDAAGQMFNSTVEYNEASLEEYMSKFDGKSNSNIPQQAGNLWNLVDNAVINEAETRVANHDGQVDEENKRNEFILSLANSYNPHPQANAAVGFLGQELLNQDHIDQENTQRDEELPSNVWLYERAQVHAINGLAERGEGYEDLVDPRMTPNNGRVSLNEDSWVKLSEDREDVFEQESRMDPRENPLVNSWDNVRNLEWPDDRLPEEKPELPEAAQERDQAFDTPRSRAHDYVTEFDLYAMN